MRQESAITIFREIKEKVEELYAEETDSIAFLIMEKICGLSQTQIITGVPVTLTEENLEQITMIIDQLMKNMPIQYILGEAHFFGRSFKVSPKTLIPRPETEGLVEQIIHLIGDQQGLRILDIGTGCGCIPITLALETTGNHFGGIELDQGSLTVARKNDNYYHTHILWQEGNIHTLKLTGSYDIIVSNPPYVLESERKFMKANVLHYEPEIALFVNDDDALIFYQRILSLATHHLAKNGHIFFEINESKASEIVKLGQLAGFKNIDVSADLSNKDRYVHITNQG